MWQREETQACSSPRRTAVGGQQDSNTDGGDEGNGGADELQADTEPTICYLYRPPALVRPIQKILVAF